MKEKRQTINLVNAACLVARCMGDACRWPTWVYAYRHCARRSRGIPHCRRNGSRIRRLGWDRGSSPVIINHLDSGISGCKVRCLLFSFSIFTALLRSFITNMLALTEERSVVVLVGAGSLSISSAAFFYDLRCHM
jgi:hypothetical protein